MAPTQIVSPVMPSIPSIPSSILSTSIETSASDVDLNVDDFPSFSDIPVKDDVANHHCIASRHVK